MLINCGVGEDSWEFLEQQDQTSQSWRKSTLNIHWKDWCCGAPILWPPDAKRRLIGKDRDAGKNRWQEKGAGGEGLTEDETVGWHHWLNGHEFEQTPGDGEGQGSLVCCSPWGHKESDTTEWLNKNKCRSSKGLERDFTHSADVCWDAEKLCQ